MHLVRKKPPPTIKDSQAGGLPSMTPCSWDTSEYVDPTSWMLPYQTLSLQLTI